MKKMILATTLLLSSHLSFGQITEEQTLMVGICYRINSLIPTIIKLRDEEYPKEFTQTLMLKDLTNPEIKKLISVLIDNSYSYKHLDSHTIEKIFLTNCMEVVLKK